MGYRVTVDVGGTFTDVVVSDRSGTMAVGKAPTTYDRPVDGISNALASITGLEARGADNLLKDTDLFIYSTTRATNAIIEGKTARTALFATAGFADVLLFRDGGRIGTFDYSTPFPDPYIPRGLVFEIPERIDAQGKVVKPLDVEAARAVVRSLRQHKIDAIAVSLLWSVINPAHELQLADIIRAELPDVSVSLSHQVAPILGEYRRTSTAAIDASLKPVMTAHLDSLATDLTSRGFRGELLCATSVGGVMDVEHCASQPVSMAKSGPSLAPVAGRALLAATEKGSALNAIVCDMGGTSFEVSLVRDGRIAFTQETWLGGKFIGHVVATSSVDARSIGAGGGSIAWVDEGGLLRVGPESAGADPGPACYGRGGRRATVTDAGLVLGYLDPEKFLGGRMHLDVEAATNVVGELAKQLDVDIHTAAHAVLTVANENMIAAISEITIAEGLDPRESFLVAGGGAAGMTIAEIAREIGCARVLIPRAAGALSAMGGQFTDVVTEFGSVQRADTNAFPFAAVADVFKNLDAQAETFAAPLRARGLKVRTEYTADARYSHQNWDLELPLGNNRLRTREDVEALERAFTELHERVHAVAEPGQVVELRGWKVRVIGELMDKSALRMARNDNDAESRGGESADIRSIYFRDHGWVSVKTWRGDQLNPGSVVEGPALVTEPTTTILVVPGSKLTLTDANTYLMEVGRGH